MRCSRVRLVRRGREQGALLFHRDLRTIRSCSCTRARPRTREQQCSQTPRQRVPPSIVERLDTLPVHGKDTRTALLLLLRLLLRLRILFCAVRSCRMGRRRRMERAFTSQPPRRIALDRRSGLRFLPRQGGCGTAGAGAARAAGGRTRPRLRRERWLRLRRTAFKCAVECVVILQDDDDIGLVGLRLGRRGRGDAKAAAAAAAVRTARPFLAIAAHPIPSLLAAPLVLLVLSLCRGIVGAGRRSSGGSIVCRWPRPLSTDDRESGRSFSLPLPRPRPTPSSCACVYIHFNGVAPALRARAIVAAVAGAAPPAQSGGGAGRALCSSGCSVASRLGRLRGCCCHCR